MEILIQIQILFSGELFHPRPTCSGASVLISLDFQLHPNFCFSNRYFPILLFYDFFSEVYFQAIKVTAYVFFVFFKLFFSDFIYIYTFIIHIQYTAQNKKEHDYT